MVGGDKVRKIDRQADHRSLWRYRFCIAFRLNERRVMAGFWAEDWHYPTSVFKRWLSTQNIEQGGRNENRETDRRLVAMARQEMWVAWTKRRCWWRKQGVVGLWRDFKGRTYRICQWTERAFVRERGRDDLKDFSTSNWKNGVAVWVREDERVELGNQGFSFGQWVAFKCNYYELHS